MDANFHVAHEALGFAYTQTGRHGEGVSEFEKAIALSGGSPVIVAELRHAYALSGRRAEAQAGLDELKELSKQAFVLPYHIAAIHTGLGERDQAFEWLEKAYQEHYGGLAYVNVEPKFDSLRADPRFTDLVRRIGLAP